MEKIRNTQTKAMSLKNETVERLSAWIEKQAIKPNTSAVVDAAINEWLDKNNA